MERLPDLTRLRYFLAVAETLNFRAAAERLNTAQPALSRAIQLLEAELGFKLLERTTRRVSLTPPGAVLAKELAASLQHLRRSIRNAAQVAAGKAGEIVVGYSAQAAASPMPELVIRLRSAVPDAEVGLYSLASDEQVAALQAGRIDVGLLLSAACRPPLRHFVVARERFAVLISKQHPLADRASLRLHELAEIPFVLGTPKRWLTFRSLINNACLQAGFLPVVAEEADDVPLLFQLLSLRRGITLYAASAAQSLPSEIKAIPVSDRRAFFDISIAWLEERETPLLEQFIDVARRFAARGPGKSRTASRPGPSASRRPGRRG